MALDRPDDDFTRPEREVPGRDVPAVRSDSVVRSGLAEWRSREECYQALRVADGRPPEDAGSREDRSGWDSVDVVDRPAMEDIRMSSERTTHILDGDETGGGHRHGVGVPGKTEFPASWDDAPASQDHSPVELGQAPRVGGVQDGLPDDRKRLLIVHTANPEG